jgi:PTH1 family peptidyl-tRNA hydrolase
MRAFMYLITALGNYGEKYTTTRHNAAWLVVDEIVGDDVEWAFNKYANADSVQDVADETPVRYIKPRTMMNLSGLAVRHFVDADNLDVRNVIVMQDDVDIPTGEFKISFNRGSANHNGVESVTQTLGTQEYIRIRIGIGNRGPIPLKNYVLMQLSPEDIGRVRGLATTIRQAIVVIANDGVEAAMNQYN